MKIINNIAAIIITLFILLFSTLKISAQEFTEPEPDKNCYQGLRISWAKKLYSEKTGEYLYYFRIFNHYPKPVKFDVWFKVGDQTISRSTGMIPKDGKWSDAMNLFKSSETPSYYIDNVCFEGMKCGGKDDCYAKCDLEKEKINQPCGSESEESSQTNNEIKEEANVKEEVQTNKVIKKTIEKPEASIMSLNGKWKCSINYIKTNNIIVVNENEFIWDWVVKMLLITNKGQMTFKRQSDNIFVADNTGNNIGNQGWCRYVAKIINDNKLELEIYNCSGKLGKTAELTRNSDSDDDIFIHAKPVPSAEKMIAVLRNAIDWQHPENGGKMDFDLTIDEKGTVKGVSVLSTPRNKELEDKVTSHILKQPIVYYHTPAERNGKPVSDNVSYSVTYTSYADLEKARLLKANTGENKN
jgi:hypothetical protein